MPKEKFVLCEVDEEGSPIRIFKFAKKAYTFPVEKVRELPYSFAVGVIRRKVFYRAGCTEWRPGQCEWCGRPIIWESGKLNSGEMHEKVFRGKGGEVSLENSVAICRTCHRNHDRAHGDRKWQTARIDR